MLFVIQEIKAVQLEDSLIEGEGEMDVSDSEEEPQRKKTRNQLDGNQEDIERLQSLKEENDSLRCQLEAYKNEVCINANRFVNIGRVFEKFLITNLYRSIF